LPIPFVSDNICSLGCLDRGVNVYSLRPENNVILGILGQIIKDVK
jgi:hypothetical protein